MIIKGKAQVIPYMGKKAVLLNDTHFFVDEPVGTKATFLAHKHDQFAYLKPEPQDTWEERSERNHYYGKNK
jgi:hypothetical protein